MGAEHTLLILEEKGVEFGIASPGLIKVLFELSNSHEELLHEKEVPLASSLELIDVDVHWLQGVGINVTHDRVVRTDPVQDPLVRQFRQQGEVLVYVAHGSQEQLELLGVKQVRASDELLEEHVQVEASFLDELSFEVVHLPLAWNRRHVESRESVVEGLMQQMELAVSPLDLKRTATILPDHSVSDEAAFLVFLRLTNTEDGGELIRTEGLIDGKLRDIALDTLVLDDLLRVVKDTLWSNRRSMLIHHVIDILSVMALHSSLSIVLVGMLTVVLQGVVVTTCGHQLFVLFRRLESFNRVSTGFASGQPVSTEQLLLTGSIPEIGVFLLAHRRDRLVHSSDVKVEVVDVL